MAFLITAFHVYSLETPDKYIFDADNYELVEKASIDAKREDTYYLEYPHVPEAEVIRSFIKAQNSTRIDSLFRDVTDERLPSYFKSLNESTLDLVAEYRVYELKYLLDKLKKWLDEQGIPHYCDHEDYRLNEVL